MKLELKQHIYTSRHYSFETVAETPGLSIEVRRKLVDHTRFYDRKNENGDAPVIYRGFPVDQGNQFAIMLITEAAPDLSGRSGNILAHSYVLKKNDLQKVGWNLPWITAHLPIWVDYPQITVNNRGIDHLDKITIEYFYEKQFDLLRLFLKTVSKDQYYQWMNQLITEISQSNKVKIGFPPVDDETRLNDLIQKYMDRSSPHADIWNLWRTAALFVLLPRDFQMVADYTINQMHEITAPDFGFEITIFRNHPTPKAFEMLSEDLLVYLEYGTDLVNRADDYSKIIKFRKNMDGLISTESQRTFMWGTKYYQNTEKIIKDSTGTPDKRAEYLKEIFNVISTPNEEKLDALLECLDADNINYLEKLSLMKSAINKTFMIHGHIRRKMIEFYNHNAAQDYNQSYLLFQDLPKDIKRTWWLEAESRNSLPALTRDIQASFQSIDDRFEFIIKCVCNVFHLLDNYEQYAIIEQLFQIICSSALSVSASRYVNGMTHFLKIRLYFTHDVWSKLIRYFESRYDKEEDPSNIMKKNFLDYNPLMEILKCTIYKSGNISRTDSSIKIIAEFAKNLVENYRAENKKILQALLNVPETEYIGIAIQFLGYFKEFLIRRNTPFSNFLINAHIEMLKASINEYKRGWVNGPRKYKKLVVPEYEKWAKNEKSRSPGFVFKQNTKWFEECTALFQNNLLKIIKRLSLKKAIIISALYLNVIERDISFTIMNELAKKFQKDFDERKFELTNWLKQQLDEDLDVDPRIMTAMFVKAISETQSVSLDKILRCLKNSVDSLDFKLHKDLEKWFGEFRIPRHITTEFFRNYF